MANVVVPRSWAVRLIVLGAYLAGLFILLLMLSSCSARALLPWFVGLTAVTAFVCLREASLAIELTDDGIGRAGGFPVRRRTFIPWGSVRTVEADLKTVMRLGMAGGVRSVESESRLAIRGEGETIVLHAPLFAASDEVIAFVLERARPAAVEWTVAQVASAGAVRLGPITLTADTLECSRAAAGGALRLLGIPSLLQSFKGPIRVSLREARRVALEHGSLRLDTPGGEVRVPVPFVPNGIYLPEIIARLSAGR
ncbi:MAG: hypothetical protein HY927_07100 [Elusimicrobia bacterium]|nr:hypothetical protein [Elusimicrobiota bacterium]